MLVITPDLREQIAALCREYQVAELSLFGSGSREDFDPERSDVDLLVDLSLGRESDCSTTGFARQACRSTRT
jgi:predicted nucleotidyltransferase